MSADAWFVRFSPDGRRIACGSEVITICRADGSEPVVVGPGTSPRWLSSDELIYTRQPDGALMHWPSGAVLDAAGFNDMDALEMQWAGWHAGRDEIVTSWGMRLPGCRMPRVTRFGVVYAQPAPGDQWRVVGPDGRVLVEGAVRDLRAAHGLVTWMQHVGGRWEVWGSGLGKVQRLHLAAGHEYWPVPLLDAGGYPWVLTHTETALWLRPWGASDGHIVHVGTTDFPDACWTWDGWRVAWSERGHLRTAHIPHDRPKVTFRETPAPPVPTPEPTPTPERPVDMSMLQTLQALRAGYGSTMTDDQCVELINAAAWQHRSEGYGLSRKTSGTRGRRYDGQECCHDVIMKRDGTYWDCLSAAGAASTPVWGQPSGTITDPSRGWVAPIAPQATAPGPIPEPRPPYQPPPTVTPTCKALSADEVRAAVRQEMALVIERVAHTAGVVQGMAEALGEIRRELASAATRREELCDLTAQRIEATTTVARPVTVSGKVSFTGTTTLRGRLE